MIIHQEEFFSGNKKALPQAKIVEEKIDTQIMSYKPNQEQFYHWQNRFFKTLIECRTAQHEYWTEQTSYRLQVAKATEVKLKANMDWVEYQLPELITPEAIQTTLL